MEKFNFIGGNFSTIDDIVEKATEEYNKVNAGIIALERKLSEERKKLENLDELRLELGLQKFLTITVTMISNIIQANPAFQNYRGDKKRLFKYVLEGVNNTMKGDSQVLSALRRNVTKVLHQKISLLPEPNQGSGKNVNQNSYWPSENCPKRKYEVMEGENSSSFGEYVSSSSNDYNNHQASQENNNHELSENKENDSDDDFAFPCSFDTIMSGFDLESVCQNAQKKKNGDNKDEFKNSGKWFGKAEDCSIDLNENDVQ